VRQLASAARQWGKMDSHPAKLAGAVSHAQHPPNWRGLLAMRSIRQTGGGN
jgi:hypothetical protein